MKHLFISVIALWMATTMYANDVVTFEDVLTMEGENAVLNDDNYQRNFFDEDLFEGMFTSLNGDFVFENFCYEDWDFYYGFAISARTETTFTTTTPDQFNSCVGHGVNGSTRYAVYYDAGSMMGESMKIYSGTSEDQTVTGFYITNTAWVVEAILEGDGYGDAFTTGDYLKLIITGLDSNDNEKTVEVYLADYTSENEADHYYLKDWTWVDLSSLGAVSEILFSIVGSRNNDWGLTTPMYFCMDDFNGEAPVGIATFEDIEIGDEGHMSVSTEEDDERTEFVSGDFEFATGCLSDWDYWYWFGYANRTDTKFDDLDDQWNNVVGGGYNGSSNYGVAYAADFNGPCYVTVLNHDGGAVVPGFYITNSSYAYAAMKDGNGAKQFGLGDWFKLTITGYDADEEVTGTKEFYLADLRELESAYIIDDWRYVDLTGLGKVAKLGFELTSTDNGSWGMNTPAYFCFDDFGANGEEILPEKNVDLTVSFSIKADNGYGTFCSEYPVQFTDNDNVEAYIATGMNEAKTSVQVQKISDGYVPAGVGVIVKAESAGDYTVHITEATDVEELEGNLMVGCIEETPAPEGCYILYVADGCFHPCSGGTIPAGKAYLNVNSLNGKILDITIVDVDPTAITEMTAAQENGAIYTLGGVRVKDAQQKGIYIINGKKVVIK